MMENTSKLCPKCGNELNDDFYCNNCKAIMHVYEKIRNTSKLLYNQGLQKAKVRDLSSAISILKRSIKLDKNNINSRNLLGLVYFEVGEVVLALEQWVVSKNISPDDNIAEYYISQIQQNQHKLARLNSAIKKYNLAIKYINQKSEDLAVIQLKKVISLNPKFLKAYCLLALLYIHENSNDKAKRALIKALSLDKNNYIALKYYESVTEDEEEAIDETMEEKTEDRVIFKGRPKVKVNDRNPLSIGLIYIVFGLVIGVAVMYFLVMPNAVNNKQKEVSQIKEQLQTATESYDLQIIELQNENTTLTTALDEKKSIIASMEETLPYYEAMEDLQEAVLYYLNEDDVSAANEIYLLDENTLGGSAAQDVYKYLKTILYPSVAESSYFKGYKLYKAAQYEEALDYLNISRKFEKAGYFSDEALYFTARCHMILGETDLAIKLFTQLLEDYPEANQKSYAEDYLRQLTQ